MTWKGAVEVLVGVAASCAAVYGLYIFNILEIEDGLPRAALTVFFLAMVPVAMHLTHEWLE